MSMINSFPKQTDTPQPTAQNFFFLIVRRFSRTFDVLLVNQSNTSDILPNTPTKHLPCEASEKAEG